MERKTLNRSRVVLLAGAAALLLTGMLTTTDSETRPVGSLLAAVSPAVARAESPRAVALRLADESLAPRVIDAPAALSGSPEARLIGIYRLIAEHQLEQALYAADQLTRELPTFKLAHLVQADLLASRAAPLANFGAASAAARGTSQELEVLRAEALLRLRALQERPPAGSVPAEFVLLPKSVRHAIAVDTSRARLYLFENGEQGLRLVSDHYISVGKQGVDKLVEGDQRTPLGVYFITDRIDARSLEDRFGAGALPLNYPNAYDKVRGRTGSGILLHGVPSNTYSRPPQDSDGCVAMSNEDLLRLAAQLPQRDTPVVISRRLQWVGPTETDDRRRAFLDTVQQWKQARLEANLDALDALYRPVPQTHNELAAQEAKMRQRLATPAKAIDELSVLTWSDEKDTMVVTFREQAAGARRDRIVRQYWNRDGKDWRIIAEGPVR